MRYCCVLLASFGALASAMPAPAVAFQLAEFTLRGSHRVPIAFQLRGRTARLATGRTRYKPPVYWGIGVAYISSGNIVRDRVRARFGGRGRINVKFKQAGKTVRRTPPRHCKGSPKTTRTGTFVGTIRFRSERGFTAVDVSRAHGKLRTVPHWDCGNRRPPPERGTASIDTSPAVLEAKGGRRGKRVYFRAAAARAPEEKGETLFSAGRVEVRPRMRIERYAFAYSFKDSTFVFDQPLNLARIEPPYPFHGSAAFKRGIAGPHWTGSLMVELLGAGPVRLADNDFSARLYRGQAEDSPGY